MPRRGETEGARRVGSGTTGRAWLAVLLSLVWASWAHAEERLAGVTLLVGPVSECSALAEDELRMALRGNLDGLDVELRRLDEAASPPGVDEMTRRAASAPRGLAVWCRRDGDLGLVVSILDAREASPRVRTMTIRYQPPGVLARTIAVAVRSVIESGLGVHDSIVRVEDAEVSAMTDEPLAPAREGRGATGGASAAHGAPPTSPPRVASPGAAERGAVAVLVAAGYRFRAGQPPGPLQHAFGLRISTRIAGWVLLGVDARWALAARPPGDATGVVQRAGGAVFAGVARQLGRFVVGGALGADLEALWGDAASSVAVEQHAFQTLNVGLSAEILGSVSLWRGAVLELFLGVVVRPRRTLVTARGDEVASVGHVEASVGVSLGWSFL